MASQLSSDGFMVVLELYNMGGEATRAELMRRVIPRISTPFAKALDSAVASDHIAALSLVDKLSPQSFTPQTTYKIADEKLNKALAKLYSTKFSAALPSAIAKALDRRTFNAAYQAVVSGKKARRDPVQRFIAQQNPQQRAHLWRSYESLDDAACTAVAKRLARLAR